MNELQEKTAQIKRKYFKDWRAKNKEKVKVINQRYWQKKAQEKILAEKEGK